MIMNAIRFVSLAVLVWCATGNVAQAQVKKCTDAQGRITYTQNSCPKATTKDKTIMAYTPVSPTQASQGRDWQQENKAFHQRQAQRDSIAFAESKNRAAIETFNAAINKPLQPGQSRETTLTFTNPSLNKTAKSK
ncbi:DUF4124 domain-containing protein [Undibacterium sp.]|uniref:DUF4124 domain-containing protein n=1 Tax=Undibacterium sp. TaxID=1914977 RepID=UPI0037510547